MVALFQRPSTVLHGADQAGLFANRPKSANNGHVYFADDLQRALIFNSRLQTWMPSDGQNLVVGATNKYLVDGFRGPILDGGYVVDNGTDAQALDPVILTTSSGGVVNGVTGNAGTGHAADASFMSYPLVFKPSDGRSVHHFRFKISAITDVAFYVGLTDLGTLEEPMSLSGTTLTTNATDAVGFLFDTAATTDNIWCAGVADDVDDTEVNSTIAPVADTFLDLSIDLSILGVAKMYINETLRATLAAAINPAMSGDMHAVITATARSTTSRTWSAELLASHLLLTQA